MYGKNFDLLFKSCGFYKTGETVASFFRNLSHNFLHLSAKLPGFLASYDVSVNCQCRNYTALQSGPKNVATDS